jgi:hypothetical protein
MPATQLDLRVGELRAATQPRDGPLVRSSVAAAGTAIQTGLIIDDGSDETDAVDAFEQLSSLYQSVKDLLRPAAAANSNAAADLDERFRNKEFICGITGTAAAGCTTVLNSLIGSELIVPGRVDGGIRRRVRVIHEEPPNETEHSSGTATSKSLSDSNDLVVTLRSLADRPRGDEADAEAAATKEDTAQALRKEKPSESGLGSRFILSREYSNADALIIVLDISRLDEPATADMLVSVAERARPDVLSAGAFASAPFWVWGSSERADATAVGTSGRVIALLNKRDMSNRHSLDESQARHTLARGERCTVQTSNVGRQTMPHAP